MISNARVNLIPQAILLVQARRRRIKGWLAVLGVSFAVAGVGIGINRIQRAEATQLEEESRHVQAELLSLRHAADEAETRAGIIENRLKRADALRAKRSWSGMFAVVTKSLPHSCWLTAAATDPPFPSGNARIKTRQPAGPKKKADAKEPVTIQSPRKLKLVGYAVGLADPYQLVTNLKATGVFVSVTLTGTQQQSLSAGDFYRFEVVCEW